MNTVNILVGPMYMYFSFDIGLVKMIRNVKKSFSC